MVGLTTSASNFFIYIALLFVFSVVMNQQLAIFTAIAENKSGVQACSAVILLFFVVFCGFLVSPDVIPNYYMWLYWWNPLAWAYRGLVLNEFTSSDWDWTTLSSGQRAGDAVLEYTGFVHNGDVFGKEWIGYTFAYLVPYALICTLVQSLCLEYVRVEPRGSPSPPEDETEESDIENMEIGDADQGAVEIPFKPVTLTFTDICYDVKASTGKEKLRLLNDVNGIFKAGRMCALMGSSGAGKTTLMVREWAWKFLCDISLD
jgi:ABC-type multidrug transport system fused ATPase/permease subunit